MRAQGSGCRAAWLGSRCGWPDTGSGQQATGNRQALPACCLLPVACSLSFAAAPQSYRLAGPSPTLRQDLLGPAPSPLVGFHDGSGVIGNEIKASSNSVKWRKPC